MTGELRYVLSGGRSTTIDIGEKVGSADLLRSVRSGRIAVDASILHQLFGITANSKPLSTFEHALGDHHCVLPRFVLLTKISHASSQQVCTAAMGAGQVPHGTPSQPRRQVGPSGMPSGNNSHDGSFLVIRPPGSPVTVDQRRSSGQKMPVVSLKTASRQGMNATIM